MPSAKRDGQSRFVCPLYLNKSHFVCLTCSCPFDAAFPGILPRDGRNITFRELTGKVRATYNFSPSFSLYVPRYIAHVLNRSYNTGTFDLSDIDVHNGIEHDASLLRKFSKKNPV
jgi:Peroxidase, family 2